MTLPLKRIPVRLLGLLLLGYVLYVIDLQSVIAQLRRVSAVALACACAAFVALIMFRWWRWHGLIAAAGTEVPARWSLASCNSAIWMGLATPARAGEFTRALMLSRDYGQPLMQSSAIVTFDLLLDLFASGVMLAAGLALAAMGAASAFGPLAYWLIVVAGLGCIVFVGRFAAVARSTLVRLHRPSEIADFLSAFGARVDRKVGLQLAVATAGAFASYAAMMASFTASMSLGLGALETLTMVAVVGVSGAIPITYFGLGTREVALIWFFAGQGQSSETAVAVSLLFLLAQVIGIGVSLALALVLRLASPAHEGHPRA